MTGCRHHTGVLLCLVGFLLLAPLTAWAQQSKSGGTLQVAWEADVAGMDPRFSPGAQAGYIMGNLFTSLVSIDAELNYVPDLAESWEVLEDGHDDKQVDALIDRMKEAPTEAALLQAGYEFQRYVTESMMT